MSVVNGRMRLRFVRCPVCTAYIYIYAPNLGSCTNKHIERQAERETFPDMYNLPRPH